MDIIDLNYIMNDEKTMICVATSHLLDNSTYAQINMHISHIYFTSTQAICVAQNGKAYMWGNFEYSPQKIKILKYLQQEPQIIKTLSTTKIIMVSCGNYAALLLGGEGIVYAFGEDRERYGILGLGGINFQSTPTAIAGLIDQRYIAYQNQAHISWTFSCLCSIIKWKIIYMGHWLFRTIRA